ncbi:hypothetical protein [Opitutus sp. ER46]|uniref:hypothetical protein n=1 Tax=Opitutus sp. ER46 TaxID=2161864 RepID=UPI000D316A5A|nr:hypothetical protein [Opitutus sp. ER46]PTX92580.1 hypothetical protein DB354_14725 [Opitutus sp. ER46]
MSKRHFILWYVLGAIFLGVFIAPVAWRNAFITPLPLPEWVRIAIEGALIGLTPLAAWLALAGEKFEGRGKLGAWYVALCATAICEVIHYWVTDRGHYFGQFPDNTTWQVFMHGPILDLSPGALPHSYRFLPDAFVQFFTWLTNDFAVSRIGYRLLFNALLFTALYRLARTYVVDLLAAGAVALAVAIYPITILKYAGQFVDPMSHFVMIAGVLCLVRRYEAGFGPLLFVGLFAKESVIVLAACRLFHGRSRGRAALLAGVYGVVALAILWGIRRAVLQGNLEYSAISGVELKHITENLGWYREWILMYFAISLALVPGAILGWKYLDREFQLTTTLTIIALVVSSLMFSWLSEIRNLMPAFMLLAIVNMAYVQHALLPKLRSPAV